MAYSLNDVYRYLRMVMRFDAIVVGLGLGLVLSVLPRGVLESWGIFAGGALWPLRLAGGLLITLGVILLLASQERLVGIPGMVGMTLGNVVIALVLLVAYLQHDLDALSISGRVILILVFVVCLVGALFPLQYLRAEYQAP